MNSLSTVLGLWNLRSPMWLLAAAAVGLYLWSHRGKAGARPAYFAAAVAVFLLATVSPLARLAHGYLFSAHMAQHLLLLLIVPGLVLLSLSSEVVEGALRRPLPGRVAAVLGYPLVGWFMGTGAMWLWHVPAFCNASQLIPAIGYFQTFSLLVMGASFWWPTYGPVVSRRLGALPGVAYLFTACTACTVLGIALTFASSPVCSCFVQPADPLGIMPYLRNNLGLTPENDQQVGGLIMWVPACLIYACGIFGRLAQWFGRPEEVAAPAPVYGSSGKE